jgi:hypothetical protein
MEKQLLCLPFDDPVFGNWQKLADPALRRVVELLRQYSLTSNATVAFGFYDERDFFQENLRQAVASIQQSRLSRVAHKDGTVEIGSQAEREDGGGSTIALHVAVAGYGRDKPTLWFNLPNLRYSDPSKAWVLICVTPQTDEVYFLDSRPQNIEFEPARDYTLRPLCDLIAADALAVSPSSNHARRVYAMLEN